MSMTEAETTLKRLEDALAEICGHLNVLHEQMVTVMREAAETRVWEGHGIKSRDHWLAWRTGLSPELAKQVTQVADRQL